MDKSFNDQELSDIMKEIEALEEGFHTEEEQAVTTEAAAHIVDESESEIVEELAHMPEEVAIPKTNKSDAQVHSIGKYPSAPATGTTSTSMSFKVQGDLSFDLYFEIGGKTVAIEVTDSGLAIQMEGGVTFTVPVNGHSIKKAV